MLAAGRRHRRRPVRRGRLTIGNLIMSGLAGSAVLALLATFLLPCGLASADVQILDLRDFSAAPTAGSLGDVVLRDEVCVRVTEGQGSYRVRIDGRDGQGFELAADSGTDRLPFSITWD